MHVLRFITLVLCLPILLSACSESGNPRPDLMFVSTRDGDYAVYAMNADGSRQKRLTETDVDTTSPAGIFFQTDPAWSPDGAEIAFSSKRSGRSEIYIMRADGSGTERLTEGGDDIHPTWSPDGKELAFERSQKIYAMAADGDAVHLVSSGAANDGDPAWSPDGKWIAFVRKQPGSVEREIWIMRPDGSGARHVTSLHGTSINPAWSPGSARLVFASNIVGSLYDLYVAGIAGKPVRRLTRNGLDTFEPAWSPDGSTIAFTQDGAIRTVDLKGHTTRLTDPKNNDSSPIWNPQSPSEDSR
jgi:Tol biopolymer transport system component